MIKNYLKAQKEQLTSHDGVGNVDVYEIWESPDFKAKVDFLKRLVVPPKSSIGYHEHGNNEELYIILEGRGIMTIGQKEIVVDKGDVIKNPPYGGHGLINDSDDHLDLLVFQLRIDE